MIVKMCYVTITCGTVIAGLSSTTILPLGVTILSIVGSLTAALSVKFYLKKQKRRLEDALKESNMIESKLQYVMMCNGDVDLSTFNRELFIK